MKHSCYNASEIILQILAAHRYGIKRVILPERNLKDLVEVPSGVLASLEVRRLMVLF